MCHAAHGCRNADQVVNLLLGGALLADGVLVGSHAVRTTVHGRNCERQHLKVELVDTAVFTDDLHAQVCALIVVGAVEEAAGAVEDVVHPHDGCRAECCIVGGVAQVLFRFCCDLNDNGINLGCRRSGQDCAPELLLGERGDARQRRQVQVHVLRV